jgi:hypothetical protein
MLHPPLVSTGRRPCGVSLPRWGNYSVSTTDHVKCRRAATPSKDAAAWPVMRTCVVTTGLTVRPPGHVIVLNGAASSGKSTLARGLQDTLSVPFLLLSGDQLELVVLDEGRYPAGLRTGGSDQVYSNCGRETR